MKVKLKETQLQKLHFLFKEQEDRKSSLSGPFRCIEYEDLDIGNGPFMGHRQYNTHEWKIEELFNAQKKCPDDDAGKDIEYNIDRLASFEAKPGPSKKIASWDKKFAFDIKLTTKKCDGGRIRNDYIYLYLFRGTFNCTDKGVIININKGPFFRISKPEVKKFKSEEDGISAEKKLQEFFNNTLPSSISGDLSLSDLGEVVKNIKFKKT